VSHGGLSLRVQPKAVTNPLTQAKTIEWIDPQTNLRSPKPPAGTVPPIVPGSLSVLEGATVEDIANGLNALGARPRDLIAIFQAIQGAGALHAELIEL
jgi:flagellar P-ring protein precursor FlgI